MKTKKSILALFLIFFCGLACGCVRKENTYKTSEYFVLKDKGHFYSDNTFVTISHISKDKFARTYTDNKRLLENLSDSFYVFTSTRIDHSDTSGKNISLYGYDSEGNLRYFGSANFHSGRLYGITVPDKPVMSLPSVLKENSTYNVKYRLTEFAIMGGDTRDIIRDSFNVEKEAKVGGIETVDTPLGKFGALKIANHIKRSVGEKSSKNITWYAQNEGVVQHTYLINKKEAISKISATSKNELDEDFILMQVCMRGEAEMNDKKSHIKDICMKNLKTEILAASNTNDILRQINRNLWACDNVNGSEWGKCVLKDDNSSFTLCLQGLQSLKIAIEMASSENAGSNGKPYAITCLDVCKDMMPDCESCERIDARVNQACASSGNNSWTYNDNVLFNNDLTTYEIKGYARDSKNCKIIVTPKWFEPASYSQCQ